MLSVSMQWRPLETTMNHYLISSMAPSETGIWWPTNDIRPMVRLMAGSIFPKGLKGASGIMSTSKKLGQKRGSIRGGTWIGWYNHEQWYMVCVWGIRRLWELTSTSKCECILFNMFHPYVWQQKYSMWLGWSDNHNHFSEPGMCIVSLEYPLWVVPSNGPGPQFPNSPYLVFHLTL